ncbi:hypothetical protein R1flu_024460 [Riccia fluitans]|uniref:Uncharacterized protein n=1 Tax=Riccia fluitans TaxID=41844 RepID=A0ABD1XVV2_9MARC
MAPSGAGGRSTEEEGDAESFSSGDALNDKVCLASFLPAAPPPALPGRRLARFTARSFHQQRILRNQQEGEGSFSSTLHHYCTTTSVGEKFFPGADQKSHIYQKVLDSQEAKTKTKDSLKESR